MSRFVDDFPRGNSGGQEGPDDAPDKAGIPGRLIPGRDQGLPALEAAADEVADEALPGGDVPHRHRRFDREVATSADIWSAFARNTVTTGRSSAPTSSKSSWTRTTG